MTYVPIRDAAEQAGLSVQSVRNFAKDARKKGLVHGADPVAIKEGDDNFSPVLIQIEAVAAHWPDRWKKQQDKLAQDKIIAELEEEGEPQAERSGDIAVEALVQQLHEKDKQLHEKDKQLAQLLDHNKGLITINAHNSGTMLPEGRRESRPWYSKLLNRG